MRAQVINKNYYTRTSAIKKLHYTKFERRKQTGMDDNAAANSTTTTHVHPYRARAPNVKAVMYICIFAFLLVG